MVGRGDPWAMARGTKAFVFAAQDLDNIIPKSVFHACHFLAYSLV